MSTPSPTSPARSHSSPDQFEAYINLAMAYRNLERWDEALSTLGRAIDRHPSEPVLYRARSQTYRLRSKPAEALDDLQRAIDLMPTDDPNAAADHLEMAQILEQSGRSEESLAACDRALVLKPNRPEIHRVRGVALMMLHRYDEAIASFDACLARGGDSAALYEARGLGPGLERLLRAGAGRLHDGPESGRGDLFASGQPGAGFTSSAAPPRRPSATSTSRSGSIPRTATPLSGRALTHVQLRKTPRGHRRRPGLDPLEPPTTPDRSTTPHGFTARRRPASKRRPSGTRWPGPPPIAIGPRP